MFLFCVNNRVLSKSTGKREKDSWMQRALHAGGGGDAI